MPLYEGKIRPVRVTRPPRTRGISPGGLLALAVVGLVLFVVVGDYVEAKVSAWTTSPDRIGIRLALSNLLIPEVSSKQGVLPSHYAEAALDVLLEESKTIPSAQLFSAAQPMDAFPTSAATVIRYAAVVLGLLFLPLIYFRGWRTPTLLLLGFLLGILGAAHLKRFHDPNPYFEIVRGVYADFPQEPKLADLVRYRYELAVATTGFRLPRNAKGEVVYPADAALLKSTHYTPPMYEPDKALLGFIAFSTVTMPLLGFGLRRVTWTLRHAAIAFATAVLLILLVPFVWSHAAGNPIDLASYLPQLPAPPASVPRVLTRLGTEILLALLLVIPLAMYAFVDWEGLDWHRVTSLLSPKSLFRRLRLNRREKAPLPEISTELPADEPAPDAESDHDLVEVVDELVLGTTLNDRDEPESVALSDEMRNRHVYLIGKTRTGKTTLAIQMFAQDMERGHGCCFIDPHGDAAEALLGLVPDHRLSEVIYFDPTHPDGPAFNPFALPYDPAKLTEDIVNIFRMLVGASWGPRMDHLLRFSILTLVTDSGASHSLRDLRRLLLDTEFRDDILTRVTSPTIRDFWASEWHDMPRNATGPILNKLSAFLAPTSDLERVFSSSRNDLDFSRMMDEGAIFIVNLAKGILSEEPSRLLGGLLVASIQHAALARARTPADQRRDFYCYVDEFQNYTVASFESILAESAKYRLNLTLANRNLGQLPTSLQRALFGNVATLIAFQVSAADASTLTREIHASELTVRRKDESPTWSLMDFVTEQRSLFEAALRDRYLGMPRDEYRAFRTLEEKPQKTFRDSWRHGAKVDQELADRRRQIRHTLAILGEQPVNVDALRTLFPDYVFADEGYPTTHDLVNLAPHHSYCRIGSAANVIPLQSQAPLASDPDRRQKILDLTQAATPAPDPTPLVTEPTHPHADFIDYYDE